MMERILLGVLFLSEWPVLSTSLPHQYHFVDENLTWTEAQSYCRQRYTDLAIVASYDERKELIRNLSAAGHNSHFWIGVYTEIHWRWSDGSGSGYRNWNRYYEEPNFLKAEFCVMCDKGGDWFDYDCEGTLPFICNRGTATQQEPELVLVNETKTWHGAWSYCRDNYTDLVAVRSDRENQRVQNLVPSGTRAWIGLFRLPNLYWSDGSRSSFSWISGPNPIGSLRVMCGVRSEGWRFSSCDKKLPFLCHGPRRPVKQQLVKLRLKTKDSVDLNHPAGKADLLKKLQDRLKKNGVTGVTLKWREQPDGDVFHPEGKMEQ